MQNIEKYLESLIPKEDTSFIVTPEFISMQDDVDNNVPILLVGHSAVGKSTQVTQLAAKRKKPLIRVNLSSESSRSGFIGTKTIDSKQEGIRWVDGYLTIAARYGAFLLLDEIDYALPDIIAPLNPILETRNNNRMLFIEENACEVVPINPEMRIFATANSLGVMSKFRGSLYPSTYIMNDAQLNRFATYHIPYLSEKDETSAIAKKLGISENESIYQAIQLLTKVAKMCRDSLEQQKINTIVSTRQLIEIVSKLVSARKKGIFNNTEENFKTALDIHILNKVKYPSDAEAIKQIINRVNSVQIYKTAKPNTHATATNDFGSTAGA